MPSPSCSVCSLFPHYSAMASGAEVKDIVSKALKSSLTQFEEITAAQAAASRVAMQEAMTTLSNDLCSKFNERIDESEAKTAQAIADLRAQQEAQMADVWAAIGKIQLDDAADTQDGDATMGDAEQRTRRRVKRGRSAEQSTPRSSEQRVPTPPSRPAAAPAAPAASGAPPIGASVPERMWVSGFGRKVMECIQKEHYNLVKASLPGDIGECMTFEAKNMGTAYSIKFSTAAMVTDAVASLRTKNLDWKDTRTGDVQTIRFNPDRTLRGRVAGRVVHSLWQTAQEFLSKSGKWQNTWSMGQQAKRLVYINVEGDAWEIFHVRVNDQNLATITYDQKGIDKVGIPAPDAQAMIDKAIALTAKRE